MRNYIQYTADTTPTWDTLNNYLSWPPGFDNSSVYSNLNYLVIGQTNLSVSDNENYGLYISLLLADY